MASAFEAGVAVRTTGDRARVDVVWSVVGEPGLGVEGVGFADVAADRAGMRWTASADVRAGSGVELFGPLYRVERLWAWERATTGASAGGSVSVTAPAGWISASARERAGLGGLVAIAAGAPMWQRVQAAAWLAASHDAAAGAGELHVAWDRRLASTLALARMERVDGMTARAEWSLVAWFSASL